MKKVAERQHAVNPSAAATLVRTPAGDAFSGLVVRVLRLGGLLAAEGDSLARPAGQTSARWQVLAAADHAPMTVADIARALGLARQSVQRVADTLAAAGLVTYAENPRHRRARLVTLTADGRTVLAVIQAAQRPWADDLGGRVGERALEQASATIDRVLALVGERNRA